MPLYSFSTMVFIITIQPLAALYNATFYPQVEWLPTWLAGEHTCEGLCYWLFQTAIQMDAVDSRNFYSNGSRTARPVMDVQCIAGEMRFPSLTCPNGELTWLCEDTRPSVALRLFRSRIRTHEVRQRGPFHVCCPQEFRPDRYQVRSRLTSERWRRGRPETAALRAQGIYQSNSHAAVRQVWHVKCSTVWKELQALITAYPITDCLDIPKIDNPDLTLNLEIHPVGKDIVPDSIAAADQYNREHVTSLFMHQWSLNMTNTNSGIQMPLSQVGHGNFVNNERLDSSQQYRLCITPILRSDTLVWPQLEITATLLEE